MSRGRSTVSVTGRRRGRSTDASESSPSVDRSTRPSKRARRRNQAASPTRTVAPSRTASDEKGSSSPETFTYWLTLQPAPPAFPIRDVFFPVKLFLVDASHNMITGQNLAVSVTGVYESGESVPDQSALLRLDPSLPAVIDRNGCCSLRIKICQLSMHHENRKFRLLFSVRPSSGRGDSLSSLPPSVSTSVSPSSHPSLELRSTSSPTPSSSFSGLSPASPSVSPRQVSPLTSSPLSVVRHRLKLTSQPPKMWFKDEGGRDNCIALNLQLVDEHDRVVNGRSIPLRARLLYEDRTTAVTNQGILRVSHVDHDGKRTESETQTSVSRSGLAEIGLRVEEVSKNHQKQKFCFLIEPDPSLDPSNYDVSHVITDAVCVRSKRNKPKRSRVGSETPATASAVGVGAAALASALASHAAASRMAASVRGETRRRSVSRDRDGGGGAGGGDADSEDSGSVRTRTRLSRRAVSRLARHRHAAAALPSRGPTGSHSSPHGRRPLSAVPDLGGSASAALPRHGTLPKNGASTHVQLPSAQLLEALADRVLPQGDAALSVAAWMDLAAQLLDGIQWQVIGYESDPTQPLVFDYSRPLYRCPGCWTVRQSWMSSQHAPNCMVDRVLKSYASHVHTQFELVAESVLPGNPKDERRTGTTARADAPATRTRPSRVLRPLDPNPGSGSVHPNESFSSSQGPTTPLAPIVSNLSRDTSSGSSEEEQQSAQGTTLPPNAGRGPTPSGMDTSEFYISDKAAASGFPMDDLGPPMLRWADSMPGLRRRTTDENGLFDSLGPAALVERKTSTTTTYLTHAQRRF